MKHPFPFIVLFVLFLFSQLFSVAQRPLLVWASSVGGSDFDYSPSIALDGSANAYTTGFFEDTVDFDAGTGTYNLPSAGNRDIFISKTDSSGNFIWAKRIGGSSDDQGSYIATDALANLYVAGYFSGTVDFDPGPGVFTLTSAGATDVFISKIDSSGNLIWVKNIGGWNSDDAVRSLAVDSQGNVYTTGIFYGTVDFDPGVAIHNLTATASDIYISKLNTSGNFIWAKRMGGSNNDNGQAITVDASGNVYASGTFEGMADFDPSPSVFNLVSNGGPDIFILKLNSAGTFVWAKQIGGEAQDYSYSIAVDASESVYITGSFEDSVDFDPTAGSYTLRSNGLSDIFIAKLSSGGNFVWAKTAGSGIHDAGFSLTLDDSGNVYTTGMLGHFRYPLGGENLFVSKISASGAVIWTDTIGGYANERGLSITLDSAKNVYVGGIFSNSSDFNSGAGVDSLTAAGFFDMFLLKLAQPISNNGYKWIGNSDNDWNNATNWSCNCIPPPGADITITAGTLSLTTNVSVGRLTLDGTLTINGHTLTINGAVTGAGRLTGSATSSIITNGNTGVLNFTHEGAILYSLIINPGASVTLGSNIVIVGP